MLGIAHGLTCSPSFPPLPPLFFYLFSPLFSPQDPHFTSTLLPLSKEAISWPTPRTPISLLKEAISWPTTEAPETVLTILYPHKNDFCRLCLAFSA